jgi:hypothetical protein
VNKFLSLIDAKSASLFGGKSGKQRNPFRLVTCNGWKPTLLSTIAGLFLA